MFSHAIKKSLFAGLVVIAASEAHAADYVFTVPVSINAIPAEFTEVEINCSVFALEDFVRSGHVRPSSGSVGGGSARRPLTASAFRGDVRVEVTRDARATTSRPPHS